MSFEKDFPTAVVVAVVVFSVAPIDPCVFGDEFLPLLVPYAGVLGAVVLVPLSRIDLELVREYLGFLMSRDYCSAVVAVHWIQRKYFVAAVD